MFITLESTREGLGKTTQAQSLYNLLHNAGYDVILTREPGGSSIGPEVRNILLHSTEDIDPVAELLLFNADRAQHVRKTIQPVLERGGIVICDRYFDSTQAYQGFARGMDLHLIRKMHYYSTGGLMPDVTFLFEGISFKEMEQNDRFESQQDAFHERVRQGYLSLAKESPARIILTNANRPQEDITEDLYNFIIRKFKGEKE